MNIKEFKSWFDEQFFPLLTNKAATFLSYSNNETVKKVVDYISTVAQGGKRFRPYLAYVGYVTEGGEEEIFPLYAAIELLHLFCLVHDDVMDNEAVRHNALTVHRHVEAEYGSPELGRSIAILVGDLLLAWAFECIQEVEQIEPYTIDDTIKHFHRMLAEVIHGQLLDVLSVVLFDYSRETIEKTILLKSAHYSFFHPLSIGMVTAGADESVQSFAEEYATNLGMAFQLKDDIADCSKDIERRQKTLISWYMEHEAPAIDRVLFEDYSGKEWSDEDEQKLMKLLRDSGALSFAEKQSEEYFLKAEDAIFNHDKTGEEIWQEIITEIKGSFH